MSLDGQLDLLDLLEPEPGPEPLVAPQHFTVAEYHPDDLDAADKAHDRWAGGTFKMYQGWHESQTGRNGVGSDHPSFTYWADLRCRCNNARLSYNRLDCLCVRHLLYRVYCVGCEYWTPITSDENAAAEAYLDHCWPGWRDLPALKKTMKPNGGYSYAGPKDYPSGWDSPGSPVRTLRSRGATRHVASGSPHRGYDVGVLDESEDGN
jgi:hypothetical protein